MQTERSSVGTEVAELPYVIVEDGHGVKHKVIDFDKHPLPKTGVIVFESKRDAKNTRLPVQGYTHRMTKDKMSEVLCGIMLGIDNRTKEFKWLPITLQNINTYDLSVPVERKKAICLLHSYIVEGSPNESTVSAVPRFRVHDEEKKAHLELKRIKDAQRALMIAEGLFGEELFNAARNLGIMTETTSVPILTAAVWKRAQDNPTEFLQMWENPNRPLVTILKRCEQNGVITFDALDGYYYDRRFLGHNEPQVFEYFRKYPDVAGTLDIKSREKAKASEKAMMKVTAPVSIAEQDLLIKNKALEKQLAEMKAKLEEQSAESIKEQVKEEQTADPALRNRLDLLKDEGKKMKMKGLHLYKPTEESISALEKKINEAKMATSASLG